MQTFFCGWYLWHLLLRPAINHPYQPGVGARRDIASASLHVKRDSWIFVEGVQGNCICEAAEWEQGQQELTVKCHYRCVQYSGNFKTYQNAGNARLPYCTLYLDGETEDTELPSLGGLAQ